MLLAVAAAAAFGVVASEKVLAATKTQEIEELMFMHAVQPVLLWVL